MLKRLVYGENIPKRVGCSVQQRGSLKPTNKAANLSNVVRLYKYNDLNNALCFSSDCRTCTWVEDFSLSVV